MPKKPQHGASATPPARPPGEKLPASTNSGDGNGKGKGGSGNGGDGNSAGTKENAEAPAKRRPRGLSNLEASIILSSADLGGFGHMDFSRERDAAGKGGAAAEVGRK